MLKKISIIMPVYNTGEYLHKCIQSILAQTLKEFELIIINDGSTDNSGEICDEYAKSDSRIKVIHKINEGVSVARNVGISVADGEYITFVDSDDWIEADMYSELYNYAKVYNADIVMCDAITKYGDNRIDENDTITLIDDTKLLLKSDFTSEILCEMAGAAWRCIYKNSLLTENNIAFPVGIPISEDRIFNIYAFGIAGSVYYIKKPYYNRFIRPGSAVTGYRKNMIDCVINARSGIMKAIDDVWNGNENFKLQYEKQTVALTYASINNEFYKDSKSNIKEKYMNIKEICNNETVINSIKNTNSKDLRSRLILSKKCLFLCMIAFVVNKKHRR